MGYSCPLSTSNGKANPPRLASLRALLDIATLFIHIDKKEEALFNFGNGTFSGKLEGSIRIVPPQGSSSDVVEGKMCGTVSSVFEIPKDPHNLLDSITRSTAEISWNLRNGETTAMGTASALGFVFKASDGCSDISLDCTVVDRY